MAQCKEYFLQPDGSVLGMYTEDCVDFYQDASGVYVTPMPVGWVDTQPTDEPDPLAIPFADRCVSIDGGAATNAHPITVVNGNTGSVMSKTWFDTSGDAITGVVAVLPDCDCDCEDCPPVVAMFSYCVRVPAFDPDDMSMYLGAVMDFRVTLNGVQTTLQYVGDVGASTKQEIQQDFTTWLIANFTGVFSYGVDMSAGATNLDEQGDTVTYIVNYSGAGNDTLTIEFFCQHIGAWTGWTIAVDAAGTGSATPEFTGTPGDELFFPGDEQPCP